MKPISLTARNRRGFPLIECNYQSATLSGYRGHCAKRLAPSFRNISHQYFQKEARRDFVGEAILFAMLAVTAALPIVSGAYAVVELCRAFARF